jgi:hypothetical protein
MWKTVNLGRMYTMMNNKVKQEKLDKMKALVNQLLKVTVENGATENEAIEATLKVQRILAKYDLELAEIECDDTEDIVQLEFETSNDVWRFGLARVIADNFCVEVFARGKNLVFYGYNRHCDTAKDVFYTLYNYGRNRASKVYKEYSALGVSTKGIKNQYYNGFIKGVKSALDRQSTALMIVTPPEVVKSFNEFKNASHMTARKRTIQVKNNADIYNKGYNDGKDIASRKSLA